LLEDIEYDMSIPLLNLISTYMYI